MTKMEEVIKCIGCGASIQSQNSELEGYLPHSALEKAEKGLDIYCQRCFKMRHYNELMDIQLDEDSYKNILDEIFNRKALLVLVVDLFDFEGSFIDGIQRFAMNNPILLVANKLDLLPKSTKQGRLRQWVMTRSHQLGLRPRKVILTSASKGDYVREVMEAMEALRRGRDVYVLGASNVGKSTLINQILNESLEEKSLITTSYFPGTTLGKIEIPLDDHSYLVDTPGIIQKHQANYYLKGKDLKKITPKKTLRPKNYQLNPGQTLFLAGMVRIDIITCPAKTPVVIYLSDDLTIHRTKTEKADHIQAHMLDGDWTPVIQDPNESHLAWRKQTIKNRKKSDILISGLGWLSLTSSVTVQVSLYKKLGLFHRPSMI